MSNPQPPKLLTRFFRWFCREDLVHAVEGDLLELYRRRLGASGPLRANLLYLWNVLTFFQPFAIRRKRHPLNLLYQFDMLRNYFKMTFRTLKANKTFTLINVLGLALSMAAFILIAAFVWLELSYDKFHAHGDRIYRIQYFSTAGDEGKQVSRAAFPIKGRLLDSYPEVEEVVRFYQNRIDLSTLGFEGKIYTEEDLFFVDPEVFDVMSFELEQGDPARALADPYSIVLTRSAAAKYFGELNPMGKTLEFNGQDRLEVTGILKEVPTNSHMQFDILVPMELQRQRWMRFPANNSYDFEQDWKWSGAWMYVLLREGASFDTFSQQLLIDGSDWFDRLPNREVQYNYGALPLADIYFSKDVISKIGVTGNQDQVYALIAIALLILTIACINFVNLSTAQAARRAKEVGLRKVMGAVRRSLISQFITESIVISAIAFALGLLLAMGLLPMFSQLVGKPIGISFDTHPEILLYGFLGILFIGFMAGIYPAFYLSSYLPARTLKGNFDRQGRSHLGLRKLLVIGQFAVSNILIVAVLVVHGQLQYVKNKDLGFDKEQTIVLQHGDKIEDSFPLLEKQLEAIPGIDAISQGYVAGEPGWQSSFRVNGIDSKEGKGLGLKVVGYNFVDMYDLEIVAGRNFRKGSKVDSASAILLNEAAVKRFGWTNEEALGQDFSYKGGNDNRTIFNLEVIGVLKDANFESLYDPVRPSVFQLVTFGDVAIKYDTQSYAELVAAIDQTEEVWRSIADKWPFEYRFLDQKIAEQYKSDEALGDMVWSFGLLAIVIACLGLFGLASFTVQKRTKEIGVRKVMGASMWGVLLLVGRGFVLLVLVAFAVSTPIAYWLSQRWLEDFSYRIEVSWGFFVLAAVITLIISSAAVSSQSIRAALLNPVDALKYE